MQGRQINYYILESEDSVMEILKTDETDCRYNIKFENHQMVSMESYWSSKSVVRGWDRSRWRVEGSIHEVILFIWAWMYLVDDPPLNKIRILIRFEPLLTLKGTNYQDDDLEGAYSIVVMRNQVSVSNQSLVFLRIQTQPEGLPYSVMRTSIRSCSVIEISEVLR